MTTHPTPTWAVLRDHAPELLDDFADLWARLDPQLTTSNPERHTRELRWLVEHLAALVEDHIATHASDPYEGEMWDGDEDWDDDDSWDDDLIGLVTL